MSDDNLRGVESLAHQCLHVIDRYSWLLDAFVLEFFTKQHWEQMPKCWQRFLISIEPEELGHWISSSNNAKCTKVWPLSLMALRNVVQLYMLPREPSTVNSSCNININSTFEWLDVNSQEMELGKSPTGDSLKESLGEINSFELQNLGFTAKKLGNTNPEKTQCVTKPSLKNLFVKHVKPKKRHEIAAMAKICFKTAQHVNCTHVIDVGAGKGHLARLLSYKYGLSLCCLEAQSDLTQTARKLDEELEYTARKHIGVENVASLPRPVHINIMLDSKKNPKEFVKELRDAFRVPDGSRFTFGIVGLHPCGDLAPTLLRLFSACEEAKFISIVGCCYMKLTVNSSEMNTEYAYPLSGYFLSLPPEVASQTYEALEIACHALEKYSQRLQQRQYTDLKIHSYRAVLEQIIVRLHPEKRRLGLRSVKHAHNMEFAEYAKVAISRAGVTLDNEDLCNAEIPALLASWKQVVVFYTLRLLVAPLVETAVLLDRLIYLGEKGYECCILPGFDPLLSPRNHILLGCKR